MIALVTQLSDSDNQYWLSLFQAIILDEKVLLLSQMSEQQKQKCDIAILANPKLSDIEQLPNLSWTHSLWAGVESLVEPMGKLGLPLVKLTDPKLSLAMAEAVLAWSLYLHRDMPKYAKQQTQKCWHQVEYIEPQNRHISILGLGALGQEAAKVLKVQGFKVSGWSYSKKQLENVTCYHGQHGLQAMLKDTHILVCLLPLTKETQGLINKDLIDQLPDGAKIINFARGGIVNDLDLFKALDSGKLDHAVLDVFAQEPLACDSAFWEHEKITVLPHISAQTNPTSASKIVASNIANYRKTGLIPDGVNAQKGY